MPQELIDAFSGRHAEIAKLVEEKIKEEERQTGKEVGPKRKAQIDLEVWRNTRKAKPAVQPSLQAKREHWYHKLGEVAPDIQLDQMMKDVNSHKSSLMHVDAECEEDVARLLLGQLADLTNSPEAARNTSTGRPRPQSRPRPTRTPHGPAAT